MALTFAVPALKSYLKVICEYELHSLPNKKLVVQRIMGKTTSRSDRPWPAIFSVIVYTVWGQCQNLLLDKLKHLQNNVARIDDYAKDGRQEVV